MVGEILKGQRASKTWLWTTRGMVRDQQLKSALKGILVSFGHGACCIDKPFSSVGEGSW